jgi:hypothetical protein
MGAVSEEPTESLKRWARANGLDVSEYVHWDAVATRVSITDSAQDTYEIYARPNEQTSVAGQLAPSTRVVVGAVIAKRGSAKHRALRGERERFHFELQTTLGEVSASLDQILAHVKQWILEAGNRPIANG